MLSSGGSTTPIANGRLRGDQISFTVGGAKYAGRVNGDSMRGDNGAWSATRVRSQ